MPVKLRLTGRSEAEFHGKFCQSGLRSPIHCTLHTATTTLVWTTADLIVNLKIGKKYLKQRGVQKLNLTGADRQREDNVSTSQVSVPAVSSVRVIDELHCRLPVALFHFLSHAIGVVAGASHFCDQSGPSTLGPVQARRAPTVMLGGQIPQGSES